MPFDTQEAVSHLADLEPADAGRVRETIAALARPRMTGTEEAAEVEAALRSRFEDMGYETRPIPFSFSALPGRFGLVFAGALAGLAGILGAWLIVAGLPGAALGALLGLMALALVPFLALGPLLDRLPWGRIETTNLLFQRPGTRPAWILMAHRDTKSQLVPTLVRTAAVATGAAAWLVLVALAGLWWAGELYRFAGATTIAGVVLALAGAVLALSWSANRSPGALDNASGLAALLEVARVATAEGDVAFLLTDGEEMGLVGARAVVPDLPRVQGVINVDGLDDRGRFYVTEGHGWRRKGSAPQLAAALLAAGAALDLSVERRTLPRSIHVDHLPIAAAGIPALTVVRGGWASLLRVHRPGDASDRLTGVGAAEGATLLAAATRLLRAGEAPHLAGRRAAGP